MDKNDVFVTPFWMISDLKLSGNALTVFAILYMKTNDGVSVCRNVDKWLESLGLITADRVRHILSDLAQKDLVIKEYENTDKGRIVQYRVNRERIRELRGISSDKDGGGNPGMNHESQLEKQPKNNEINKSFEAFWQAYIPTNTRDGSVAKGSKKLARDRYERIIKSGVTPADILIGLEKYLDFCHHNDRFTCQAAVFLSQERWKDEYPEVEFIL